MHLPGLARTHMVGTNLRLVVGPMVVIMHVLIRVLVGIVLQVVILQLLMML
jgi:hypothetical protein